MALTLIKIPFTTNYFCIYLISLLDLLKNLKTFKFQK